MKTNELKKQVNEIYNEKGLNAVYNFLKKEKIKYDKIVFDFGLKGNKKAQQEKEDFIKQDFCFHYYNRGIKSRKTGYNYNILRGIYIKILK